MNQNPNNPNVQGFTDSEVELMLGAAYDVPPIPRSLLKRLDSGVAQEWGVSPGLARRNPSPLSRAASRGSRVLKAWPIAASLALIVMAIVMFQNNASAYGWAKMMDALTQTQVVEMAEADGATRWMSVTKGVVGERSASVSRVLDFGRGIMLERDSRESQIKRWSFTRTAGTSQQEAAVIAFFAKNVKEVGDSIRQSNLKVIDESWSSGDGDEVLLRVTLGSETETSELSIAIDRKTHLPKNVLVGGNGLGSQVAIFYPATEATELLARDFPTNLPVIDAAQVATAIAAVDTVTQPDEPRDPVAVLENTTPTAPLVGAASLQWQPVEPSALSSDAAVARINATLEAVWKEHNVTPAESASDAELLRRVYLDLVGRTPGVSEVRAYLTDRSPDRYAKLVDRLLASRDHVTHLATIWRMYLIPEGIDLTKFGGTESFEDWIGKQFADQVPYDEIVRRLLLAEGRLSQSGPLLFYAAVKLDPDQLATRSARVFLGMRLDCAQCHDDKFEPWLQDDFWSYAAFFAQISRPQGALQNVSTVMQVRDIDRGDVKLPDSETVVEPQFLDGSPIDQDPGSVARRRQLAEWLTAANNPYFARATVNRVWGQLFGKGIVDPVDGFGTQHKPVSQELLDQLAGHFIASDYDLRELHRTIVLSRAYRLSSGAETVDPQRHEYFAQMNVKLLTAEQMYDCITVASMLVSAEAGSGFNLARVGNATREQFLQQFRAPAGRSTEYQSGIPQALTLMNGGLINNATGLASSGLLESLKVPFIKNKDRVEILYLATLSRRPTPSEQELLGSYISEETSGDELYESLADVLWALLNSAEFTMNH